MSEMVLMKVLYFLILVSLTGACSKKTKTVDGFTPNPAETTQNFFKSVSQLTIQVAYEPGAEPYTDNVPLLGGLSLWWILEENLNALYLGRSNAPIINVPKTLPEFTEIPTQNKSSWTLNEIMNLAQTYRTGVSSTSHSYFWVVFLNGHFNNGDSLQTGTIGLSIQGTTVLAIFKDVVKGTASGQAGVVPKYVEQSTLVHEVGHALGLVNKGLPMVLPHEDTNHPGHCDDPDCVMFWLNEGTSDVIEFVRKMIAAASPSPVMFGPKCLKDSREY